jgi:starch phosphorylase
MRTTSVAPPPAAAGADGTATLLRQYGCGPVAFTGTHDALYDRHLLFDNVINRSAAGPRERFEAFARSVRDVLSQRWVLTEDTYAREDPKRVYYLSMEFLIGRSLANNVTNLLLDPVVRQAVKEKDLDWLGLLEQEPDAGLGNGGLGRLAACYLDSMATTQLPAMGYGLRYEYGMFRQTIENGYQVEHPDNWLRRPDPWEVARPNEAVQIQLGCSFEMRGGALRTVLGKTGTLIGIPFDRPVVGHGGKTVNTLRLWAATVPDYFDFQEFSKGDFVGAVAETLSAESLSSTRSTAACSTRSAPATPATRGASRASASSRKARASTSAWRTWPSSARTAPTAWRPSTPSCCGRGRSRTWLSCSPSASAT